MLIWGFTIRADKVDGLRKQWKTRGFDERSGVEFPGKAQIAVFFFLCAPCFGCCTTEFLSCGKPVLTVGACRLHVLSGFIEDPFIELISDWTRYALHEYNLQRCSAHATLPLHSACLV